MQEVGTKISQLPGNFCLHRSRIMDESTSSTAFLPPKVFERNFAPKLLQADYGDLSLYLAVSQTVRAVHLAIQSSRSFLAN